jgi:hypothetical protein
MLKFRDEVKLYVSLEAIDARKSIDGLCALVLDHFSEIHKAATFLFF